MTNYRTYLSYMARSAVCALALASLAACTSAPARDADVYYDLRPQIENVSFGSTKTMKLQSVSVKGLQSARPLVFEASRTPAQYQEVRGHLWHVAPSTLLEVAIGNALISASTDLVVGTSDNIDDEDLRLRVIVSKFHFSPNDAAHIAFDAVIKDRRGKIVSSTRYDVSEPITAEGYENAVLALEAALAQAITALAKDIAATL